MGFKTGLIVGLGAGYVLGAKAGKERYDQIVEMARSFTDNKRVQDLVHKGRAAVDLSADKARGVMSEGLSATSRKLRSVADNGDGGSRIDGD